MITPWEVTWITRSCILTFSALYWWPACCAREKNTGLWLGLPSWAETIMFSWEQGAITLNDTLQLVHFTWTCDKVSIHKRDTRCTLRRTHRLLFLKVLLAPVSSTLTSESNQMGETSHFLFILLCYWDKMSSVFMKGAFITHLPEAWWNLSPLKLDAPLRAHPRLFIFLRKSVI